MSELHMGAYVNRQSAIHKLSVKLKLLAFVAMIVYTLVSKNAVMYGVDFLIIIICTILSKLKIAEMIGFLKRLWVFFVIILLMNTLFYGSNNPVFHLGIINVSYEGFLQGLKVVLNVVLILMWANILLCTTSPIELMNGIRFFLTPLKLFKVPVDNLTLIISVAIQFIPTLLNEASNIKKAQIARGAQFESKNIFKKAAAVLPLIIPIFVSAFKRADELSQALEARGYQGSE
jgi:energy-coupling factor transport system permease protein